PAAPKDPGAASPVRNRTLEPPPLVQVISTSSFTPVVTLAPASLASYTSRPPLLKACGEAEANDDVPVYVTPLRPGTESDALAISPSELPEGPDAVVHRQGWFAATTAVLPEPTRKFCLNVICPLALMPWVLSRTVNASNTAPSVPGAVSL